MPNWCSNSVVLFHSDPKMIAKAKKGFKAGKFAYTFCPTPKALQIVSGSVNDPVEQNKLDEQQVKNRKKYGYEDWYDFQTNEWGTKWDFGAENGVQEVEGGLQLTFETAWCAPLALYSKLEALGFSVEAMYYECGMSFCGMYAEGEDEFYDLSGMSSDTIAVTIPEVLDEAFCISENIANYESEEDNDADPGDMDGDFDSAMASAGFGTDEDYNHYEY